MTRIRRSMKHLTKIFLLIPHIKPWNLENNSNKSLNLYVASKTKISDRPKKKKPRQASSRRLTGQSLVLAGGGVVSGGGSHLAALGVDPHPAAYQIRSPISPSTPLYTPIGKMMRTRRRREQKRAPPRFSGGGGRRKITRMTSSTNREARKGIALFFFSERKDWGAFWASGTAAQG